MAELDIYAKTEEIRNMSKKSTKLEALHDLFAENNIQVDLIEGNGAIIEAVKKNAGAIQDYRHQSYVRHPLVSIVMIVFLRSWLMRMNGQRSKHLQKRRKNGCGNIWTFLMGSRQTTHTASSWAILIQGIFFASR